MQQIIHGENCIQQLGQKIRELSFKSVFLITGSHWQHTSDLHLPDNIQFFHWLKQGQNVDEKEIEAAQHIFMEKNADAIIVIGGGSVIDLGKAIIYQCVQSSKPVPFFIAAPTTAGSGSEATHFAVVYNTKKKKSLVHHSLLPQMVFLDPALTYSLPAYQTAVSGMDALAQAIESYWNKNATKESKDYAAASIALWKGFFQLTVQEPGAIAREKMLQASHLAGKAINITRTTGPHALSYYLTANHNIPHGQAVSLFLPLFFLYNQPQEELCLLLGVKSTKEAAYFIRDKMKEAGLITTFSDAGIDKSAIIDGLLDEVNEERFTNNPVSFDREKLKQLILTHL